ncbi:hypothetical protein [Ketobacter sp.]
MLSNISHAFCRNGRILYSLTACVTLLTCLSCALPAVDKSRLQKSVSTQKMPAPYPDSQRISGLNLDWSTHQRHAQGSDNFQMTWAEDNNLYGAWGDGGGFGGTNNKGRVSLGVARIEGDLDNYQGYNVWGGFEAENPATFPGKSWGMIGAGTHLYMWTVPGKPVGEHHINPYRYIELATSQDQGKTWHKSDWQFTSQENLTIPTFLNFGRDNAGVPSRMQGYIYSYFIHPEQRDIQQAGPDGRGLIVHKPGRLYLARIADTGLPGKKSDFEFFSGLGADGTPRWGTLREKQPVFEDANGVGWCLSASYHPATDRVLLATEHDISHQGQLGVFESPNPWGPWSTVEYYSREAPFGAVRPGSRLAWNNNLFYLSFITKWFDGNHFTISFTGGGKGKDNDSFNIVSGRFITPE